MKNLLNVTAHMLGKASGSDSLRHNRSCTKRTRHDRTIRSSSSKGVVALMSGNWAAHVYVNHNWICIGIFKTEEEAEMAYESTTIKLLIDSRNKNLQKTDNIAQEPIIQKQVYIDGTHSYRSVKIPQAHRQQKFTRTRLFEMVLTPSDVGKLYRLVIPKMYASCFSCVSDGDKSSSDVQPFNDELAFYDQSMILWKFRNCVWKGSNTYVFSSGWRNFVQAKDLRPNDKVIFYKCEHVETESVFHTYLALDVEYNANKVQVEEVSGNRGKYGVTDGEESHLKEGVQNLVLEKNPGGTACIKLEMDIEFDNDFDRSHITNSGKAPETSVMPFGVNIA